MTRLNEQQIEIMKDELDVELADWPMETYGFSASEALVILYNTNRIIDSHFIPLVSFMF